MDTTNDTTNDTTETKSSIILPQKRKTMVERFEESIVNIRKSAVAQSQLAQNMDDEETVVEEFFEPQITSEDPEERKMARRLRIQRRIEAIKKSHEKPDEEDLQDESTILEKQIEESVVVLEKYLIEGEEMVTNVRVGNDSREVNRREKDAARRQELLEILEKESKDAEDLYQTIYSKWDRISKYKDPLDISDSIAEQKEQCDELVKQKDEIIKLLKEEINQAEMRYCFDQESQEDDIDLLVVRIDQQVSLMRRAYRRELEIIEMTIQRERKKAMQENTEKWENLQEERKQKEELNLQIQVAMADEFIVTFYNTRVEYEEKFREMKIQFETENERLGNELEQLKAACLLSGEKLDYNYNILKKREDENLIVRSQQKRMLNKLQDEINKIRLNMKEYKTKAINTIAKLTFEIKKTRNLIFEIEKKAAHICLVNDRRFEEIWELNEQIARKELDRIKQTDKIIYEQLLGLEWKNPFKNIINKENLSSYKEAVEVLASTMDEVKQSKKDKYEDFRKYTPIILRDILEKIAFRSGFLMESKLNDILPTLSIDEQNLIRIDNVFDALGIKKEEDFKYMIDFFLPYAHCPTCDSIAMENSEVRSMTDYKNVHPVVSEISTEAMEEKVSLESLEIDQEMTMEDIRHALDELPTQMIRIITAELEEYSEKGLGDDYSVSEAAFTSSDSSTTATSDDFLATTATRGPPSISVKAICKFNHPLRIDHVNVYKILKEFVTAFNFNANEVQTLQKRLEKRQNSLSRLLMESDIKVFWEQFGNVFTQYHEELWTEILYGLKRYHAILIDRQKIYGKVLNLRKENLELKHMLKNCTYKIKKPKTPRKIKSFKYRAIKVNNSEATTKFFNSAFI